MRKKKNSLGPPPIANDLPVWILIFTVGALLVAVFALV